MIELLSESFPEQTITVIGLAGLLFASFTSLFSVVNPLATMPLFLSLTDRYTNKERIQIAKKASFYMFGVLFTFLFVGTYILSFFGISLAGIRIAGGFIALAISVQFILSGISRYFGIVV